MLKASANSELFTQPIPERRDMLDAYINESEENLNNLMINIGSDHYSKSSSNNNYNNNEFKEKEEKKIYSVSSKYNNDSRFGSVSSEQYNQDESESQTQGGFFSFVGSALSKTKEIAGSLTNKVYNMELGSKIMYGGSLAVQAVKYTGSKVYEKGSDLVVSRAFH